jgi:hypothetical protein
MTWILLAASVILATVDSWVTAKRIKWEINPLVRVLHRRLGTIPSVGLGVLLPQASWAFGLSLLPPFASHPCLLGIFLGTQLHRTYLQYLSRNFKLPEWDAKPLPSLRQSTKTDAPPPSGSNHSGASREQGSSAVNVQNFRRFIHSTALKPC